MSKFFHGASLLAGNNTTPGVQIPEELKVLIPDIFKACRDYGLDFYPTVVQMLSYDEISEVAAYGGFPVRYPHWQWGMEYEELQRGYEYGMHRIYEMVVNCCESGTHTITDQGTKTIGELRVGDKVFSRNGIRTVVAVKKQQKSKVMKIHLNEHASPVTCTPNHKWLVLRSIEPEWVETKNLLSGDIVLAGSKYENFLNYAPKIEWNYSTVVESTLSNVRWKLKEIFPPTQMNLELAELLGIVTGDGSCGVPSAENVISVCIDKKLKKYQERVLDLFSEVFVGADNIKLNEKETVSTVDLCSKAAVDYFDTIGFKKGSIFETKRVPDIIWKSSNEFKAAYLRGLFDTDGYVCGTLGMSCKNEDLAKDVQLLLLELGIRSKVNRVCNDHNNISVITIKGRTNVELYKKYIGFSLHYKNDNLNDLIKSNRSSGKNGLKLRSIQDYVVSIIENIPNQKKLPTWIRRFKYLSKNKDYGFNSILSFSLRAKSEGYNGFNKIIDLLETPMYEVDFVEELSEEIETIDIALDHDDHDFLANGLMSHNTNPCYLYCLDSNTTIDNVTVIAHALGHNDFFKNNVFFEKTSQNMMNQLANNGTRIRKYMARWGKEKVTEFIDHCLRITTLIDPSKAWDKKQIKDVIIKDTRKWSHPRRLNVNEDHEYMDRYINKPEWIKKQNEKIKEKELYEELELFNNPTKDIMPFIRDNAPLKPWQADIMAMLYQESIYFAPQRTTKMLNEGWASFIDSQIMCRENFVSLGLKPGETSIIEYAKHKMGVLGGKYSSNPYKLGYSLFLDIEDRWNKGKFGTEYDSCTDMNQKMNWDLNLGLGKEKIFEVRKNYNDFTALLAFFTPEFCEKHEFFNWKRYPGGDVKLENRNFKEIKKNLCQRYVNGGLPEIVLVDPNHKGKGYMFLEHKFEGRELHMKYLEPVLQSLYYFWKNDIYLSTKNTDGEEIIYCCYSSEDGMIEVLTREAYEKKMLN